MPTELARGSRESVTVATLPTSTSTLLHLDALSIRSPASSRHLGARHGQKICRASARGRRHRRHLADHYQLAAPCSSLARRCSGTPSWLTAIFAGALPTRSRACRSAVDYRMPAPAVATAPSSRPGRQRAEEPGAPGCASRLAADQGRCGALDSVALGASPAPAGGRTRRWPARRRRVASSRCACSTPAHSAFGAYRRRASSTRWRCTTDPTAAGQPHRIASALSTHWRNVDDEQLRAVADTAGCR